MSRCGSLAQSKSSVCVAAENYSLSGRKIQYSPYVKAFGAVLGLYPIRPQREPGKEAFMSEQKRVVTMKGSPLTLVGNQVSVGETAPDFVVIDNNLAPVKFSSFRGRICIISSVPSLDTPVCDLETKMFNEEAGRLEKDVVILTISMDLPFAQKRWCAAAGVNKVQTLSDHRDASFGNAFGVLIRDLRLLARAVFLIDQKGAIRYVQLVKEITNEPDYKEIWSALKAIY